MDKMVVVITADAEVIPANQASDVESNQKGDDE